MRTFPNPAPRLAIRAQPNPLSSRRSRAVALLLLSLACPQLLRAQTLEGTLLDDRTGQRIWAGTVTLLTADSAEVVSTRTDRGGKFVLHARGPGTYRVRAERARFTPAMSAPMELKEGDTIHVQLLLLRSAVVLNPLVVHAPRRLRGPLGDFYDRLNRMPWGKFVTREEIERRPGSRATDLLRRISGVQLVPARGSFGSHVLLRGTCHPTVFVNGTRVPLVMGMTIDDLVSPTMLEGIEVYKNAIEVPAQYGLDVDCGAILLWTR